MKISKFLIYIMIFILVIGMSSVVLAADDPYDDDEFEETTYSAPSTSTNTNTNTSTNVSETPLPNTGTSDFIILFAVLGGVVLATFSYRKIIKYKAI